ncbi:MAG: hypothetical protein E7613_10015 [Ruminococcaceae bacterium]|nr:hypothetical protein [Oscillospiraceae bacterium]
MKAEYNDTEIEIEDGYFSDNSNKNAAKVIHSKNIVSFDLYFCTNDIGEESILKNGIYHLSAAFCDGKVNITHEFSDNSGRSNKISASTDTFIMEKIQKIADKHSIARYNGEHFEIKGLPNGYGGHLHVDYDSGEYISVSNNGELFMPLEAFADFESLFKEICTST